MTEFTTENNLKAKWHPSQIGIESSMDHVQQELTRSLLADLHNMEGGSSLSESA